MADQQTAIAATAPPENPDRLASFVSTLLKLKTEAVQARLGSGIEDDWIEDEEHYQGIDDANRALHRSWLSSIKRGTPIQTPDGATSTAFLNVTRPVVDVGAAKVADIWLPVDDRCWAIKPTPVQDMPLTLVAQLKALGMDPAAVQQAAEDKAAAAATAMQDEIDDHFVECNWNGEVRQVIEDAARIGSGVLKGPFPLKRKIKRFDAKGKLSIIEEIKPASKWVSPWNFFPDGACGENIHNGSHTFERDYLTNKTLQDLIGQPGYIDDQIRAALKEGPKALASDLYNSGKPILSVKGQFELWTFYGQVASEDLKAAGMAPDDIPDEANPVNAMALLVNDRLIKITFNAMDTGEFPYDVLAWQRRPGMPWGTGVGRHGRTPQRMLNAGVRQMLDNGALACAPQIVIGNGVTPSDNKVEIRGRKVWRVEPDGPADVRAAFASFTVQSVQAECMGIINLAMKMIEETTGMPSILQGQEPDRKETLGQAQMRVNNASGVMRRLAKRFDDYITKPHVRRYYNWLMQYSDRPDIKGDFSVDVRAFSALVEKDAQLQFMLAMMNFAKDPAYGMNPYFLVSEIIKANRMQPKQIQVPYNEYTGSQGPSPLEQAKIGESAAKAKLIEAQTSKELVTTEYEAVQGAAEIVVAPEITPVADELLRAANFPGALPQAPAAPNAEGLAVDAVKNHRTGVEFTPGNTHPNMPSPPAGADVGAQAGIEGGQQ